MLRVLVFVFCASCVKCCVSNNIRILSVDFLPCFCHCHCFLPCLWFLNLLFSSLLFCVVFKRIMINDNNLQEEVIRWQQPIQQYLLWQDVIPPKSSCRCSKNKYRFVPTHLFQQLLLMTILLAILSGNNCDISVSTRNVEMRAKWRAKWIERMNVDISFTGKYKNCNHIYLKD